MAPPMRGPRVRGMKPQVKNPGKLFMRLLKFVFKKYPVRCIVVFLCICVTVFAKLQGTMFLKTLIDDFIVPLTKSAHPDFDPLAKEIFRVACFYLFGTVASFIQGRALVVITQGSLKDLRNEMFSKMQSLPIKYFDTHSHGDIMSIYTNDIDTLRQIINSSIPQIIESAITIISTFVCMVALSIPLTLVTLLMVGVVLLVTKKVAGQSSKYFVKQQKDLGTVNGYIEEMINGQKVVKVFCYEEKNIEDFNKLNEQLFDSAYNAHKYANVIGPINGQLGHLSYVLCAIVGGIIAIVFNNGIFALSLGELASFLTFNKSFSMPINQISQQFNSIIMALAGAERVFGLLDETPETDEGYVVRIVRDKDGFDDVTTDFISRSLFESCIRTGYLTKIETQEDKLAASC